MLLATEPGGVDAVALAVFLVVFALVCGLGFVAARWRRPATLAHLDEWSLGGRRFGTWITWFLLGGDLYTAYTIIAVPALIYAVGAYGFFALPYTIIVYPLAYVLLPRLWQVAAEGGHVTAADVVAARFGSRRLEVAIALTGIAATMPYIALQLVGMQAAIRALGLVGDLPLIAAFTVLGLYTYTAGLRAPALIAFAKDGMIYIVVIAAIALIPLRLGGFGHVFNAAGVAFAAGGKPGTGLLLSGSQMLPYASVAFGSALALFLYPHTLTGVFAAAGGQTLRRNAMLLPAYVLLLGFIALLGYVAIAAGVHPANASDVVPVLFHSLFPSWFAGFAEAAIAVGALVPAAVMSIGAATLFTRNVYGAIRTARGRTRHAPAAEARVAQAASLAVKAGALAAILLLPTQYAIDLQLLGGVWILQSLPALILGLYTRRLAAPGLLAGWATGIALGSTLAIADGLKPVHTLALGGHHAGIYTGLLALAANIAVAYAASAVVQPHAGSASNAGARVQ